MNISSPDNSISLFVKDIITMENNDPHGSHSLPFYADGLPGIMFHETENGLFVTPHNKKMPLLFLYGQTIHPIELKMEGPYKLIVFKLYPFVIESFFGVDPQTLNDACYDLMNMNNAEITSEIEQLRKSSSLSDWTRQLTSFLYSIFEAKKEELDYTIRQAIVQIVEGNGQQPIKDLIKALPVSERTFERRFQTQVGVTPKQFSKMIQFHNSLSDLKNNQYSRLSDIVYKNGFADQSHFIRVFKAFTGNTPGGFTRNGQEFCLSFSLMKRKQSR